MKSIEPISEEVFAKSMSQDNGTYTTRMSINRKMYLISMTQFFKIAGSPYVAKIGIEKRGRNEYDTYFMEEKGAGFIFSIDNPHNKTMPSYLRLIERELSDAITVFVEAIKQYSNTHL